MDLRFISRYKYRSIFTKTLAILIGLMFLLIMIFYGFSYKVVSDQITEKFCLSNLNMLGKTCDAIDLTLSYINQSITQVSENENIISTVVAPSEQGQRDFEVANLLHASAGKNPSVEEILLYVPFSRTVYTSSQKVTPLDRYEGRDTVETFIENASGSAAFGSTDTRLFHYGDDVYMVRDFPMTGINRLGTLFYKLSPEAFRQLAAGRQALSGRILVMDAGGEELFGGPVPGGDGGDGLARHGKGMVPQEEMRIAGYMDGYTANGDMDGYTDNGEGLTFRVTSALTGWGYVLLEDRHLFAPEISDILLLILPLLIMFFFVSLFLSLYITRTIYAPINRLLSSVTRKGMPLPSDGADIRNEYDLLTAAFDHAAVQNSDLNAVIREIAPDIEKKLFRDLLSGHWEPGTDLRAAFTRVGSVFGCEGRYVALAILLTTPESGQLNEVEAGVYFVGARNLLYKLAGTDCALHVQLYEGNLAAAVLEFDRRTAAFKVKEFTSGLIRDFCSAVQNATFQVQIGRGQVYDSMEDIGFSFQQAREQLMYIRYMDQSTGENEGGGAPNEPRSQLEYYRMRVGQVAKMVEEEDMAGAQALADRLLSECTSDTENGQKAREALTDYCNAVEECLIELHVDWPEGDTGLDSGYGDRTVEELTGKAQEAGRGLVSLLEGYYKKRRHKFIVAARSYIDEHYSDSSLSLNGVAGYLGVNPSYLSKLFTEALHKHFNDYLNECRVEEAKKLLMTNRLTVKEIGYRTGFNSVQNFIRVFKRYENVTPGQYRDLKRG